MINFRTCDILVVTIVLAAALMPNGAKALNETYKENLNRLINLTVTGENVHVRMLGTMTRDFPRPVRNKVATSWYPGIARDYFLDEFNMLTFRIEFTTVNQGVPEFRESGRAIIDNLHNLGESFDWSYVYP